MPERPNILHVFCDQQRFDTISALGNDTIRTPNFDRIAREGVAFTNCYSPSPVCISARCSMIYGQYPHSTGCYENTSMPTDGRQSLMGALTDAGYCTHGIGKCHFSPDLFAKRGFKTREIQEEMLDRPQRDDYMQFLWDHGYEHLTDPHGVRGQMYYIPQPAQMSAECHPTNWVGRRSAEFVRSRAERDQPWYLFSSFIHPHPPFCPPAPWHKLYRVPEIALPKVPESCEALHTWINKHQNRYKYRDRGIDKNLVRTIRAYYYACVSFIDYQVGCIMQTLEETGQGRNTLIICTADHGEHLGDYNCFGKRSMHDTGVRVPMLVRLPGRFEGGRRISTPTSLVDVAPTILSAADASISTHRPQGVDMNEIVEDIADREVVFSQHGRGKRATYMSVSEQWKYFYSAADNQEYLFDRVNDPEETRNVAALPTCAEDRERMKKILMDHLVDNGETEGIEEHEWKEFPTYEMPSDPDEGLLVQDHPWADLQIPGYSR